MIASECMNIVAMIENILHVCFSKCNILGTIGKKPTNARYFTEDVDDIFKALAEHQELL